MWVGTSDITFYVRGPGSRRSGIRFEIKIDKFREIKFTAVSGAVLTSQAQQPEVPHGGLGMNFPQLFMTEFILAAVLLKF